MKDFLRKADLPGLVIVTVALIFYSIRSTWSVYQTIAVGVGAALVAVSLILRAGEIREGLGRRSSRFGINSGVSVLFFLGILAGVNYYGSQYPKRADFTTEKFFSLSEQSLSVADQVKEDLSVKAFYPGGDYAPVRDLLALYAARNARISYEFIDPDKQPQLAQQYNVQNYGDSANPMTGQRMVFGTLVLEMAGKTERVEKQEALREEDLTNTLMKIVKGERKTIYFVEGHGEKKISDTDPTGLDQVRASLEKENYVIKPLNLVQEAKVPDDASVVVIAGPTSQPFPNEMDAVNQFLEKGGAALVMVDPAPAASMADFLGKWQVTPNENVVVDASGVGRLFGAGPAMPLVATYGTHRITQRFNVMTFYPRARSLTAGTGAEGFTVEKLLETSERSWGETAFGGNEVTFDEAKDLKGPVTLGVVVTKNLADNKKGRLVAFGDSDFATNAYFGMQGNGNLFLNAVNWLAQDENFISIRPKSPEDRRLTLTEAQGRLSYYITIVFLPLAILITGVSVWNRRRK